MEHRTQNRGKQGIDKYHEPPQNVKSM